MTVGEWQVRAFEDVIDFREGPGILAKDFRENGIPLVRLSGLSRGVSVLEGCDYLDPDTVSARWSHFQLDLDDILLSASASLGRIAVVGQEGVGAVPYTGIIRMRPKGDSLYGPYIRYLLEGPDFQEQAEMVGVGSVIRHFGPMHLRQMTVQLPPLPEQRAIARVLGALDDKIELNRRMNETLEEMARALFKSWFVDFEPVRAKMEGRWRRGESLPGLPGDLYDLFPDRLVDSELGEIPEGWGVKGLGELVQTTNGRSYRSEDLKESETALVTLKSFARGGGYRTEGLKPYVGQFKAEQVISPGEIVIACTDVTQAAEVIGRPAIVQSFPIYKTLVASLDTLIVRPNPELMSREFLYLLASTPQFTSHTYAHTTGTTVLHLIKAAVPSFKFARPKSEILRAFDVLVAPIFSASQRMQQELYLLAAQRDALLPRLVSGEVGVAIGKPSW